MIRVAYVIPQGEFGGAERATLRMIEHHDRASFELSAVLLTPGPVADALAALDVPTEQAPQRPHLGSATSRRAARLWISQVLRRHDAAIVHSVMAWTHALVGKVARRAGIAPVWFQHTPPSLASAIDWWAALTPTRCILANSTYTARLQRRLNLRRYPIEIVHPPAGSPGTTRPRQEVRKSLGVADDQILALLPGRLQRSKGQAVAVRAVAQASDDAPNLTLVLAGDTAFGLDAGFKQELETLARRLGQSNRVALVGFQEEMGDLYAAADVVLQPSLNPEGFGLVTAEALAAGRPVIASDTGGTAELIRDGENGLLVRPGDIAALAEALTRLATDAELRARLSAGTAVSAAPPEHATERLETLYRQLLDA